MDVNEGELLSVLRDLTEQDTTNPPGNEYLVSNVVKKFFLKNKIRFKIYEKKKNRTNIIGYIGRGKPTLILAVHSDVVPAGDGWNSNPFKMVMKSGKLYGRGMVDNKGQMACCLICAKMIKSLEKQMKGSMVIACVADEERGSELGLKYLVREKKISGDYAIVPDIENGMKRIAVGEKGLLFLKIISLGRQAHGSTPELGVNAIDNMLDFLNEFRRYKYRYRSDILFTPPTKSIGYINGGVAANVVPGKCEARLDIRYLPSTRKEDILKDIRNMFVGVKKKNNNASFRIEIMDDQKPFILDRNNVLTKSLVKNIRNVCGWTPEIYGTSGTTVAKPLAESGVMTAVFSPGEGKAHAANECVKISELVDFTKIIRMTAEDILF
ncbi:MAG: ArgE/DapE family deacylase [Candidatus Aenigmarchaeota archaeon]|nr:ArgE/DapE family deacylase [Candidatus Aenigmarchaeota archaeon]